MKKSWHGLPDKKTNNSLEFNLVSDLLNLIWYEIFFKCLI